MPALPRQRQSDNLCQNCELTTPLSCPVRSAMLPATLREARAALLRSKMLRAAFGEAVVRHYARAAAWEIEEFDRVVTDYEVARGFERA